MENLIEIRCPLYREVLGKVRLCNFLRVKVVAGSKGEAYCPHCKKTFKFEVDKHYHVPVKKQRVVTVKAVV